MVSFIQLTATYTYLYTYPRTHAPSRHAYTHPTLNQHPTNKLTSTNLSTYPSINPILCHAPRHLCIHGPMHPMGVIHAPIHRLNPTTPPRHPRTKPTRQKHSLTHSIKTHSNTQSPIPSQLKLSQNTPNPHRHPPTYSPIHSSRWSRILHTAI